MDLLRERLRAQGLHCPCVAAALIGSAVVGGVISSSASKSAANTDANAANQATQAQEGMFNTTVGLESPFRSAGVDATSKLSTLLGIDTGQIPSASSDPEFGSLTKPFSMSDFQLDPGIQFQTQQGNLALQNSQAAKDGVLSGSALKDLIGYNSGMAATGYQSAYDRYMANKSFTLGSLMDVAKQGQAAAGNTVNSAGSFSSGIAGTIQGAGNAQAAGTVGSANALSGAVTGSSNGYLLSNLLNGGTGGMQGSFSQTGIGSSGFGTGLAYGNQDMGQFF